jgi:hypothetical protein
MSSAAHYVGSEICFGVVQGFGAKEQRLHRLALC